MDQKTTKRAIFLQAILRSVVIAIAAILFFRYFIRFFVMSLVFFPAIWRLVLIMGVIAIVVWVFRRA